MSDFGEEDRVCFCLLYFLCAEYDDGYDYDSKDAILSVCALFEELFLPSSYRLNFVSIDFTSSVDLCYHAVI